MIDTKGQQMDPLFPVSNGEREKMQEDHLDLLIRIAQETQALREENQKRKQAITELLKQATEIQRMLRESRPRPK